MDKPPAVPRSRPFSLVLTVLLLCAAVQVYAKEELSLYGLALSLPAHAAGWESAGDHLITSPDAIAGNAGQELRMALDFGCLGVLVRVYSDGEATLTMRAFLMKGGPEAFGVFSHFRDGTSERIGQGGTSVEGRLYFWKGPVFFALSSGDGAGEKPRAMVGLGSVLAAAVKAAGPKPRLLAALPAGDLIADSILYFRKQSSLDPRYVLADENVLGLDGKAEAVLAEYSMARDGTRTSLIIIRYRSEREAIRARASFSRDYFPDRPARSAKRVIERTEYDGWAGVSSAGRFLFIVLDAPDRGKCGSLLRGAAEAAGRL